MDEAECKEYLGKLFLRTLESKEDAIKTLMTAIRRNFKVSEGLKGTLDRFEENNTPEHRERQLKTCIKFLQETMELNSQLSLLALSYVSGDSMEDDIMKILNKLGYGQEVLQYMFEKKMGKL